MSRRRQRLLLWLALLAFGGTWMYINPFPHSSHSVTSQQSPTPSKVVVSDNVPAPPTPMTRFEMYLPGTEILSVETLKPPPSRIPQANLTKPFSSMYFPPLFPSLQLHNLPCVGIRNRKPPPPKPMPENPKYVLLVDSWERQQTGTKTVENAASIVAKFDLVFVMPHVRMSNIQGIPGWTQWRSTHALDGFTAASYLLPMWEYYDIEWSKGHLPMVTFDEFLELSNYTITTALMMDWEKNNCRGNRPEWYPSFGARIQATQLYCMQADFPSARLSQPLVDDWFTPGKGVPLPEAEGRPPPPVPSVAFLNWRKHSFGSNVWSSELWRGQCRFRWNPKWNKTATEWAKTHLPDKYVAIKMRSGDYFRYYWLPKTREEVVTCFDHMAKAAKYYLKEMGLPLDTPVYLSTEWPNPPESRWHYDSVSYVTAAFNLLHKELNLVTYRNKDYDIGIVTIISFYMLLNAAVVIGLEDTMLGLVRQYNPDVPLAVVGSQSGRRCDTWDPPDPGDADARFLYLVQGKKFMDVLRYSERSKVLCLTWGERVDFCDFLPNSTWTTGRNYLWKKAIGLPERYSYYIFLDDDVLPTSNQAFEAELLKWRPAIGVPAGAVHFPDTWNMNWYKGTVKITSFDALFNAYHHDVVFNSLVLPYYDGMDDFSWWSSQLYAIYLANIFHPGEIYGLLGISVANTVRGKYPQAWDLDRMNEPFIKYCMTNETFRQAHWKGFTSEAEVFRKPLAKDRRHALDPEVMKAFLQQDTPYWNRIRGIREEAFRAINESAF